MQCAKLHLSPRRRPGGRYADAVPAYKVEPCSTNILLITKTSDNQDLYDLDRANVLHSHNPGEASPEIVT